MADSLSELLQGLTEGPPGPVRVRDMVDHFGHRAFGAMLFAFSVPNLLPLPPGSSTFLGMPLVLLSPQLALGVKSPWLPRAVTERTIERQTLKRAFDRIIPHLRKVERLCAPRLSFMFGPIGDRLIGLVCFLLALVLILPIPLGNMLPAAAVAVFALGLTQRDGAMVLLGYLMTGISVGVLVLSASAVVAAVQHLARIFGV
ncbi:MAG: exopolysaccharide biosynthesis protein exod [Caulobacterales bacterium 32-69-10]|nr:MAG: exopolysaccharide biosynthesis protein exod [Caulobacterales bacterium 32-69-10]